MGWNITFLWTPFSLRLRRSGDSAWAKKSGALPLYPWEWDLKLDSPFHQVLARAINPCLSLMP